MRKYLIPILASALFLNLQLANSQTVDFQITVTNASSDTACDGEIDIQCVGCGFPVNYTWYDTTGYTVIGTGNHVTGLCVTHCDSHQQFQVCSYGVYVDDNTCPGHKIYCSMKDATICGTTFQVKTSLHYADGSTNNFMKINQVSGGVNSYSYDLYNDLDNFPLVWFDSLLFTNSNLPSVTNVIFDSLYDPYSEKLFFTLLVGDTSNNYIGSYFTTVHDTNTSCFYGGPAPLWSSAQGYPTSDSVTCDGWAYATAYGGTAPYSYQFTSGATDSTETGLCPGSYMVTVRDADSNVFNTTFIIGYPGTIYFSDPGSYNYIDTLYSNAAANCGLDYSMPIDSFYIDSSYAVSNWAYIVNWVIVQDTNVFDFTETYFIDSTGDYLFGLSIYCDARSSTFGSYSFFAGAHADANPGVTNIEGIKENNEISVYPNPSNGIYHLTSSSKMKEYMIFDQLGRKVISKKVNSADEMINITGYGSGMYYLIVQYQDGTSGKQKLFKK